MALDVGSITVDEDGNVTGDGLSLAIFNGCVGGLDEDVKKQIASGMKPFCEGLAEAIIEHFKDNAEITVIVKTTDSGLQRMSNPLVADADAQGPSTDKTITGTIS